MRDRRRYRNLVLGAPSSLPRRPSRVLAGTIRDASPHFLVLEVDGAAEQVPMTATTQVWRGGRGGLAALVPGRQAIVRPNAYGAAERIWVDIGRVTGTILAYERNTVEVDMGPHRGRTSVVIPPHALGRILVRHPRLEPGYLIDVICVHSPDGPLATRPGTSQPGYRPADLASPAPDTATPDAIHGTITWFGGATYAPQPDLSTPVRPPAELHAPSLLASHPLGTDPPKPNLSSSSPPGTDPHRSSPPRTNPSGSSPPESSPSRSSPPGTSADGPNPPGTDPPKSSPPRWSPLGSSPPESSPPRPSPSRSSPPWSSADGSSADGSSPSRGKGRHTSPKGKSPGHKRHRAPCASPQPGAAYHLTSEPGIAYPFVDPEGDAGGCPGTPPGCVALPYLSVGSEVTVHNQCADVSATLPVIDCGCVAARYCDRCVECGTSPRGRLAELTPAAFVALGGDLDAGCFNAVLRPLEA